MARNQDTLNKRKAVTFTVRPELIEQARALSINTSKAAERGIEAEIRSRLQTQWLSENKEAIQSHNSRIENAGTLITPYWVKVQ